MLNDYGGKENDDTEENNLVDQQNEESRKNLINKTIGDLFVFPSLVPQIVRKISICDFSEKNELDRCNLDRSPFFNSRWLLPKTPKHQKDDNSVIVVGLYY